MTEAIDDLAEIIICFNVEREGSSLVKASYLLYAVFGWNVWKIRKNVVYLQTI